MSTGSASSGASALAIGAASLLLLAALALSATEGDRATELLRTARTGVIAYSYDGDIYVGNPTTGESSAIVTHPAYELNPVFSPDGKRIAFIRGDPQTPESTIVVVRADGSDEREILPKGRKHRGFALLAWTPDGESLVAQVDSPPHRFYADGELSIFDSYGMGEEQRLAPPLVPSIGAHYWGTSSEVAPMFRPSAGDEIVAADMNELKLYSRDLTKATPLGERLLKRFRPYRSWGQAWAPDGERFLLTLERFVEGSPSATREGGGNFVMSAEGDELRRLGDGWFGLWSPDGSQIAFERTIDDIDRAVIVVANVDTGQERILKSSLSTPGRDAGARFPTLSYNNLVHHWYYEGWKWSPDGRNILILENLRTRPWIVEIETDTVTKLPWLADSMPSWQSIPSG